MHIFKRPENGHQPAILLEKILIKKTTGAYNYVGISSEFYEKKERGSCGQPNVV